MNLVPNWKRAHRMISVQLTALNGGVVGGWSILPEAWKQAIPQPLMIKIALALFVLTVIARVVDQGSTTEPKP